jgi:hypothetical protein
MRKIVLAFLLLGAFMAKAQEVQNDTIKPTSIESLKESIDDHSMKIEGYGERLATIESDLAKLTKIKVSGYIQAQYDMYDTWTAAGDHGNQVVAATKAVVFDPAKPWIAPVSAVPATFTTNSFFLRRARIKFAYEAVEGVKFVLQPDFAFDKVSLKDAYVVLNDRWTKTFSLFLGQFDRPNYEVEYSSGSMETLERTKMAGILYPGEKELGAKLEANFDTKYNFPLKLQLAVLNGNFNLGTTANQTKDIDNNKDVMVRAVYSLKLAKQGLGIDFGGHGYIGKTEILPGTTGLTTFSDANNNPMTVAVGDKLDKNWFGAEMQVYYDFLGGAALKGEYISGTISGTTNAVQSGQVAENKVRDFKGFYATFIKNIGVKNQFIARYDVWDPNTKLDNNAVAKANELKYSTWSLSWQYFFDDNIKVNVGYSLPTNEKSTNAGVGADYLNRDKKDNTFTIRLQAKF